MYLDSFPIHSNVPTMSSTGEQLNPKSVYFPFYA